MPRRPCWIPGLFLVASAAWMFLRARGGCLRVIVARLPNVPNRPRQAFLSCRIGCACRGDKWDTLYGIKRAGNCATSTGDESDRDY